VIADGYGDTLFVLFLTLVTMTMMSSCFRPTSSLSINYYLLSGRSSSSSFSLFLLFQRDLAACVQITASPAEKLVMDAVAMADRTENSNNNKVHATKRNQIDKAARILDFAKRRVVSIFICVPLKVRSQETPSPTVKKRG
jgi:hypothetical protein